MLMLKTQTGWAIPIEEYDKLMQKNLESIKFKKKQIKDSDKISSYNPEVIFKNVYRDNEDGTRDVIISAEVVKEIRTGYLAKPSYRALRFHVPDKKGLLPASKKWQFKEYIQIGEKEIISEFNKSLTLQDLEATIEHHIQKGGNIFG